MPRPLFVDIATVDMNNVMYGVDAIEAVNPQRGHMRMLDAVVMVNETERTFVAYKDVRHDEFWVPDHIPGRPLFPGVLMIEAAAQVGGFVMKTYGKVEGFVGFAGVDGVKFRGQVLPGDRFVILGKILDLRARRSVCAVQGVVNGVLVFE
ncbi:MAG: hypothetical protein WD768_03675, partial [Phycisphaeraceae bacterium]